MHPMQTAVAACCVAHIGITARLVRAPDIVDHKLGVKIGAGGDGDIIGGGLSPRSRGGGVPVVHHLGHVTVIDHHIVVNIDVGDA